MKITALIIDDEEPGRVTLKRMIETYCKDLLVIGEAEDINQAENLINLLQPDVVFLDITMPGGSGFDLLSRIPEVNFEVVFITAHNDYALQAIKASAIDYLMKPLSIEELEGAWMRIQKKVKQTQGMVSERIQALLGNLAGKEIRSKIAIPSQKGFELVHVENIIRIEADGAYTKLILDNGSRLLCTLHLNQFEDILPTTVFFRAHHSHIINMNHVLRYIKGEGGSVVMTDKVEVDISKRKKRDFMARFQ